MRSAVDRASVCRPGTYRFASSAAMGYADRVATFGMGRPLSLWAMKVCPTACSRRWGTEALGMRWYRGSSCVRDEIANVEKNSWVASCERLYIDARPNPVIPGPKAERGFNATVNAEALKMVARLPGSFTSWIASQPFCVGVSGDGAAESRKRS